MGDRLGLGVVAEQSVGRAAQDELVHAQRFEDVAGVADLVGHQVSGVGGDQVELAGIERDVEFGVEGHGGLLAGCEYAAKVSPTPDEIWVPAGAGQGGSAGGGREIVSASGSTFRGMSTPLLTHTPMEAAFLREHGVAAPAGGDGYCGYCGRERCATVPAHRAVSNRFTAWDDWTRPGGAVCQVCRWAFSTPVLRSKAMLIESDGRLVVLDGAGLLELLSGPLGDRALSLPLRPGRKHTLPAARWGLVSVDDALVSWERPERILRWQLETLRTWGFTVSELTEGTPDYRTVSALGPDERVRALAILGDLAPWRGTPAWSVAVRASTPSEKGRN